MEENWTSHIIRQSDARKMAELEDNSIELVVTSPPYPMIEMWDGLFSGLDPRIGEAIGSEDGNTAFRLMLEQLDKVWKEVSRVTRSGGIVCINVGDATRNLGGAYQLYPTHAAISRFFRGQGFEELPSIIWKKPSNSPNKFLGSGTLPVNAYVTLEHEFILIFRKTPRRTFSSNYEAKRRQESAFFWEERNQWFTDIWDDLRGTRQKLNSTGTRKRSGAFPIDVPLRLINMYSIQGDTVLDPFGGTGTTMIAAAASQRNSVCYEIDQELAESAGRNLLESRKLLESIITKRIEDHLSFLASEKEKGREFTYFNENHNCHVVSRSETEVRIRRIQEIYQVEEGNEIRVNYF